MSRAIETNYQYMPNAYKCAIEVLANGDRTLLRFNALCDHFEKANALPVNQGARSDAWGIACRRYLIGK